jgi:hypothetical protein
MDCFVDSLLALLAGLLLIAFGGITDRLIPLFAVGAFGAFTLSQAGMVIHWKRVGGAKAGTAMLVNAIGAGATAMALVVILSAKFLEGAWITLVLIPPMFSLFLWVKRHYAEVARQMRSVQPLAVSHNDPPVVVVPLEGWNRLAERALRFALRLSPEVIAVHVSLGAEDAHAIRAEWTAMVEGPLRGTTLPLPRLTIIPSPYRRLLKPLLDYIEQLKQEYPTRIIAVVIPDLVETHLYQYMLHNQRAAWLKADLFLHGDQRVVVINMP